MVFLDVRKSMIGIFDSLARDSILNYDYFIKLINLYLKTKYHKDGRNFKEYTSIICKSPTQENSWDCGIYVMLNIRYILKNKNIDIRVTIYLY